MFNKHSFSSRDAFNDFSTSIRELGNDIHAIDHIAIISMTDLDGKIIYANQNFCNISGYSLSELMGQDHRILNSNYHPKEYFAHFWNCLKSGKTWEGKVRNKKKNGDFYWVNAYCVPIFNQKNEIIKYVSYRFDITEQMNAEAEVKYLSTEEDAILLSSKFLIITTDVNGIISRFNKESELALGFKASELIGNASPLIFHDLKEIASVANELSIDPGLQVFIHKAKLGLHEERQWTYIRKDKTTFPVKLSVTALRDTKEALCGYLGIAINISSEIKAKEELDFERSKSMHNAKLASLGEMSAGIAHEINNPLTIIQGTISTLSGLRENEEKFTAKISTLTRSVDRITKIVKKLKNFSHKADNLEFSYSTASEIIQESISLVEHKAKMFATSIEIEISTDQKIYCNIVEIEQVIINLLNNAIDAIQDLEDKWIKIHLFQDGSNVIVNIIDSGNGISPELESKLFTPFFTTKKIGEGTGLGLSIVQEIIDRHKGSIKINRKFKNTCFEIIFPMNAVKSDS